MIIAVGIVLGIGGFAKGAEGPRQGPPWATADPEVIISVTNIIFNGTFDDTSDSDGVSVRYSGSNLVHNQDLLGEWIASGVQGGPRSEPIGHVIGNSGVIVWAKFSAVLQGNVDPVGKWTALIAADSADLSKFPDLQPTVVLFDGTTSEGYFQFYVDSAIPANIEKAQVSLQWHYSEARQGTQKWSQYDPIEGWYSHASTSSPLKNPRNLVK